VLSQWRLDRRKSNFYQKAESRMDKGPGAFLVQPELMRLWAANGRCRNTLTIPPQKAL
jgi:hypothetical protein